MWLADGLVMMGDPGTDYESPKRAGRVGSQTVHVYVDDVDTTTSSDAESYPGHDHVPELREPGYGDHRYNA